MCKILMSDAPFPFIRLIAIRSPTCIFFSCYELLGLFFLVPSQHPITIFNKKLILVILSALGSSN